MRFLTGTFPALHRFRLNSDVSVFSLRQPESVQNSHESDGLTPLL